MGAWASTAMGLFGPKVDGLPGYGELKLRLCLK